MHLINITQSCGHVCLDILKTGPMRSICLSRRIPRSDELRNSAFSTEPACERMSDIVYVSILFPSAWSSPQEDILSSHFIAPKHIAISRLRCFLENPHETTYTARLASGANVPPSSCTLFLSDQFSGIFELFGPSPILPNLIGGKCSIQRELEGDGPCDACGRNAVPWGRSN